MNSDYPIIIIDDEKDMLLTVAGALNAAGFSNTAMCLTGDELFASLQKDKAAVVLLDLNMPLKSGEQLLPEIVESYPESAVIVLTGVDDVDTAVRCIKNGAFDYLVKPFKPDHFVNCIKHAIEICSLRSCFDNISERFLKKNINNPEAFSEIITENKTMLNLFSYCEGIATGTEPILITGETGVGKELVAKAIHVASGRKGKFVAINIAGLDGNMFNSALFGYSKGAFTGAVKSQQGLVEEAENGTLFLDEIGDLSIESQVKLFRLIQEHEYLPLGTNNSKSTNARIITATNMDLDEEMEKEKFRKDLYFRLTTHSVHIPPLRERLDDIVSLLNLFIKEAAEGYKKKKPTYPPELISLLKTYHFPGNIRELRSMVFDAVSVHESKKLSMRTFRSKIRQRRKRVFGAKPESTMTFPLILPTVKHCTTLLIEEAMKRADHNQKIAAESLGMTQQALNKRFTRAKYKANHH